MPLRHPEFFPQNIKESLKMKKLILSLMAIMLIAFFTSCEATKHYKKVETESKNPVNCATAEADIRVLHSEKVHTSEQIAAGVSAIIPISLVVGLVMETEGTKIRVATGEYNKMLDAKIAEIRQKCLE
jgi:hypothetical protein